MAVGWCPAARV